MNQTPGGCRHSIEFLVSSGQIRDQESVCEASAGSLLSVTSADGVAILLFDDDGVLRFKAWRELPDDFRACAIRHSAWRQGREQCAARGAVPDVAAGQKLAIDAGALLRAGIRGFATLPIASGDGLLGVLLLCYERQHECGREEQDLAQIIATQIAQVAERQQGEALRSRTAQLENQLLLLLEELPAPCSESRIPPECW